MERIQRLVRSLRTARAAELSSDPNAAVSTLLPLVMKNESKSVSELLLSSDFDVNHRIRGARTLLHIAANVGAYDCLVILIRNKADVNCQDRSGITPLQVAARNGHVKCIQKLLENKADIEISNCDGMTALHWVASNGRIELLGDILPFVKNIDIQDTNRQTPLHLACLTGHKIIVQKLIENGANFEILDYRGNNPLMYACRHGQADIVNYLLCKGGTLSNNYDGSSPLQIALENGQKEVCFILIEHNSRLLENLLVLAQRTAVSEDKILGVLKYLASKGDNYHYSILIRLSEHSRTIGLELLASSSDYNQTQQRFFKSLSLLCAMISFSSEDLSRPRSETAPQSVRSRLDSTGARVLRTLTNTGASVVKRFLPPAAEYDDILDALWCSLEDWFVLIQSEIRKIPKKGNAAGESEVKNPDQLESKSDNEDIETRLIASELVRSNPIDVSVRPKSTASLDSIRMSQPAVEFNMTRQYGDHSLNRGLYREISRRLYEAFNANYSSDCAEGSSNNSSELSHENLKNEGGAQYTAHENAPLSVCDESTPSNHSLEEDAATETVYSGNVFDHRNSDGPVTSETGDLEAGCLSSAILEDNADSTSEPVRIWDNVNNDMRNSRESEASVGLNGSADHPFISRSISYTNAVRGGAADESNSLAESVLQLSMNRTVSRAISADMSSTDASQCKVDSEGKSDDNSDKESMVERFADRLCAVLHGYHLFSYSRPFWESPRKFKVRVSKFDQFIERNEEVLQLFIARKPKLIFDHFQFVLDSPIVLQRYLSVIYQQPFKERLEWFYENLHRYQNSDCSMFDEKSLMISRDALLLSSCGKVLETDGDALKRSLAVQFEGEAGMGDGVVREWFDLLFKEVLNPDYALFTLSSDGSTFQPNSNSAVNPDHLNYFLFAGKMMGLAMFHKRLISACFTRSFYKHILGIPVNYQDVASMDPEYAKSLQWILDNDISNLGLEINFAVETREFGETNLVPLKPGGTNTLVTEDNKEEYVQLAADMKMTRAIKPQIYSFLEGFHEFIPHSLVALFDEYELELVLSGTPEIDCDDWEKNTIYQGGASEDLETIKWFWEVVREYNQKDLASLLQFVTGSSRVPWGGFSSLTGASGLQKFTISSAGSTESVLPSASTCFNLLKLPDYQTKQELSTKLQTALKHGTAGFEFT